MSALTRVAFKAASRPALSMAVRPAPYVINDCQSRLANTLKNEEVEFLGWNRFKRSTKN